MKRANPLILLAAGALALGLTGCGSGTAPAAAGESGGLSANYENALPVETQLTLGTLKLEGTENALTKEQAAELLPLWQMMKELAGRDNAAPQEKAGLTEQIRETMTADQVAAIAGMKLTRTDLSDYLQQSGFGRTGPSAGNSTGNPGGSGFTGGGFPDGMGEPPAGFAVGGGSRANGGQNLSAEQIAALQAARSGRTSGTGGETALLNTLIALLETKQAA
jgi:hypothetical protein